MRIGVSRVLSKPDSGRLFPAQSDEDWVNRDLFTIRSVFRQPFGHNLSCALSHRDSARAGERRSGPGGVPGRAARGAGRIDRVVYRSAAEVEQALRDAAAAHGEYEKEKLGGVFDEEWPAWYAAHMARAAGLEA